MRERQLNYQMKLAAAQGAAAWRRPLTLLDSDLLQRRGCAPLRIRVPRPMTGVDEKDGGVLYVRTVPLRLSPAAGGATAAAHARPPPPQPPSPAPPGSAAPLQRMDTPPMMQEQPAKRSRHVSPPVPSLGACPASAAPSSAAAAACSTVAPAGPFALPPAGHLVARRHACRECGPSQACRCAPVVIDMAPLPAPALQLEPAERAADRDSPLDRFSDWLKSLLSPLPPSIAAAAGS